MISLEKALEIVLNNAALLGSQRVNLADALGRVLAEDVFSDINMPPFNKSAMDGFACRTEDLSQTMKVIEVIPAGTFPKKEITPGTCAKIMTGAPVPRGADIVVKVEDTRMISEDMMQLTCDHSAVNSCCADFGMQAGANICFTGEDIKKGTLLIKKRTIIKPVHIAVMASVGCTDPLVSQRPQIGIIATGSELVEPAQTPELSQIRNSNGSQMTAQCAEIHVPSRYYGIAPDNEADTHQILKQAVEENDVVMLSGGVSAGDFDFVPKIMKQLGFTILFDRIAVQPGKPTTFAVKGQKYIFGMPGNPVSSFIQFEMLVKPFLFQMAGAKYQPRIFKIPLAREFKRRKADRTALLPVFINAEACAELSEYHGSAHINGLDAADGIITVPCDVFELPKGQLIDVRQI